MPKSISWDDWRIVDAIASQGTTSRAAAQLNMNQSTVFRRVSQLEETLGVRLFERDKRGFRLTPEGEAILPDVRRLRDTTSDIERQVMGLDARPAGEVRLSLNSTVLRLLLSKQLLAFRQAYPDITLRLDVSDRIVNIRDREADLVVRGSNDPDPNLFGRRIMRLAYAVYAGSEFVDAELQSNAFATDPSALDWIGWDGALLATDPGQWMRNMLGGAPTDVCATDVESTADLAADGHGCALLPQFLGDQHPGLTAISDTIPGLYTELWVLTHDDLRKTARVSALLKYIASANHPKISTEAI